MGTRERSKICELLDAQLYVLNMLKNYIQGTDVSMEEGAKRCICGCLPLVYKEAYYVHFSIRKWKRYLKRVEDMNVNGYYYECETGTVGKMLVKLKIASGHSYLMYLIVGFLYRNVFDKYILPRMK